MESKNLKVAETNKGKSMILSKCAFCDHYQGLRR